MCILRYCERRMYASTLWSLLKLKDRFLLLPVHQTSTVKEEGRLQVLLTIKTVFQPTAGTAVTFGGL